MPVPDHHSPARIERMIMTAYAGFGIGAAYYWYVSPWESMYLSMLALLICFLGLRPILVWLKRRDDSYPLVEVLQLTLVPFYAVPLLTQHKAVMLYPESLLIKASWLVVTFQITCSLGGRIAERYRESAYHQPWWREPMFAESSLRFTAYTLSLTTLWLVITSFTDWIPAEFTGTGRAIFFGIGIVSAFIQARLWGGGLLGTGQKTYFVVTIVLQMLLNSLSLLLITSLVTFLLVLVGYFSAARRVPWLVCISALLIFGVLHGGKSKMRDQYWGEYARQVAIGDIPDFYLEWFQIGLASGGNLSGDDESGEGSTLIERASLFQIVCHAIDVVPERTPYFTGDSYASILPQIIPRFLWPGKPSPNDSGKLLAVRLGLLSETQAETTSIGFGLISEAYVNFGFLGTGVLGFVIGWSLHRIARATAVCSTLSAGGIFRILCLAWCLNTEQTLVVWLSSFYQACIAIFVPLLGYFYLGRQQ